MAFLAAKIVWGSILGMASLGYGQSSLTEQPKTVDPPAGQVAILSAMGRGTQVYRCQQTQGQTPVWVLAGPQAKLYVDGKEVGTHAAGPVWTYQDGSSIRGKMIQSVAAPSAGAVAWLLLQGMMPTGKGLLSRVEYIQRSETTGGQASPQGCDTDHVGTTLPVPYTATYTFYAAGH
jgi:hypothetical protein